MLNFIINSFLVLIVIANGQIIGNENKDAISQRFKSLKSIKIELPSKFVNSIPVIKATKSVSSDSNKLNLRSTATFNPPIFYISSVGTQGGLKVEVAAGDGAVVYGYNEIQDKSFYTTAYQFGDFRSITKGDGAFPVITASENGYIVYGLGVNELYFNYYGDVIGVVPLNDGVSGIVPAAIATDKTGSSLVLVQVYESTAYVAAFTGYLKNGDTIATVPLSSDSVPISLKAVGFGFIGAIESTIYVNNNHDVLGNWNSIDVSAITSASSSIIQDVATDGSAKTLIFVTSSTSDFIYIARQHSQSFAPSAYASNWISVSADNLGDTIVAATPTDIVVSKNYGFTFFPAKSSSNGFINIALTYYGDYAFFADSQTLYVLSFNPEPSEGA